jgi:hypothetical protein
VNLSRTATVVLIIIGIVVAVIVSVYNLRHKQSIGLEMPANSLIQDQFSDINEFVTRASRHEPRSSSGTLRAEQVEEASQYIKSHCDHSSFHLLCALREQYPATYFSIPNRSKVLVLSSALSHSEVSYDWGTMYPPDQGIEGECGEAIVAIGRAALPFLVPILDDTTLITAAGSGGMGSIATKYKYRRADYAYRFICVILKREFLFDPDPQVRDTRIEKLKEDPVLKEAIEHD